MYEIVSLSTVYLLHLQSQRIGAFALRDDPDESAMKPGSLFNKTKKTLQKRLLSQVKFNIFMINIC